MKIKLSPMGYFHGLIIIILGILAISVFATIGLVLLSLLLIFGLVWYIWFGIKSLFKN